MGFELTIDRIEKSGTGFILTGEHDEQVVSIKVKDLCGAREGDIVLINRARVKVLEDKTRRRREEMIALQKELSD
jgi:hypothetical protein